VLKEIRARAMAKDPLDTKLKQMVHICSENNFPTAAGLASSAAGYACLVKALAELYGVADTELSSIARVGSGSACRSVYGGWVRWTMGVRDDGVDSVASQVVPADHWPEMQILILVVNAGKKGVSSSSGMQTSVATSALIKHRAAVVVPERMKEIEAAIEARDFDTFGKITIKDSNQFHAICLDTYVHPNHQSLLCVRPP
jgi:diphosphomevalonate decarboxylase